MIIKKLSVNNFRNYNTGSWEFSDGVNVFYGKNGQGKTNLLEAVYFCGLGFSHRTHNENELVNFLSDDMSLNAVVEKRAIENTIRIKKHGRQKKKEISIDKVQIKPRELIGELKVTMFSPEDLQLVKNEPALRRRFLDMQISQINSVYCFSLARYNKIMRQRNILLKQIKEKKAKESSLEVWDGQLAKEAAYIFYERMKTVDKLSEMIGTVYEKIAGKKEISRAIYKIKANGEEKLLSEKLPDMESWYKEQLLHRRQKDIDKAVTGVGPHRDDIVFTVDERTARSFSSQGQQRSLVLALKMAEITLIKEETGEYPVLLLDDVMSELDSERRKNLMSFLDDKVQTFITLTEKDIIADVSNVKFYEVKEGLLKEDLYE